MTYALDARVRELAAAFGRDVGWLDENTRKITTDATRAPLPTDDETQGYAVGSRWLWQGQEWVRGAAGWIRNPVINAQAFGDLTAADARPAIEAAMAFAAAISPLGAVVELPAGIINVGWSGEVVRDRRLGIRARSNVTLRGQGPATVLRVADGANIDLIASDRWPGGVENTVENFHVEDMTLDGNAANQNPANLEGWNLCLWGFKDCGVKNVRSLDPANWGIRLEYGDGLILRDIVTRHGPATNADGIHLVDVDNVVGGGLDVYSEGDDAFIIEATNKAEILNYALTGLLVEAPLTGHPAGARGCMLLVDETVNTTTRRGMRNISIAGLVATNCTGPGIVLIGGDFDGVNIKGVADGCGVGLALIPGNPNQPGEIKGCSFDVDITRSTGQSAYAVTANGTLTDNHIRLGVIASAATEVPVQLAGSRWSGSIAVRHLATATLPPYAVSLTTAGSALAISTAGCAGGLQLQGSAVNNSIMPGVIRADGGGNSVNVAADAGGNGFHGGKLVGSVVNSATAKFFGVAGAENYNAQGVTTDTNGIATITHGLQGTPLSVVLTPHSPGVAELQITGRTATDFSFQARNTAGNAIASTAITVSWRATL